MKFISCLLLFVAVVVSQENKPYYDLKDAPALFEKFIKDYNRNYKDEADKAIHYQEFVKSLEHINKANKESPWATFDINDFTDYTPEQRKNLYGTLPEPE